MNVALTDTVALGLSAQDILDCHFSLTHVPDEILPFDQEGAEGWTSPEPHPVLSIGKWTTADPQVAAEALKTLLAKFRESGRGFDWMTGPEDEELLPLLKEHGFIHPPLAIAAMVRDIRENDSAADPNGITTSRVKSKRNDPIARIMSSGFDIPDNVSRIYHNAYVAPSEKQRTDVYVAMADGAHDPVGFAYLSYIGDGTIALLRVAATLPEYRGRGVYRALIRRRLADAARFGAKHAVVHAYSKTSETALAALGFSAAGELHLHRWRP